LGGAPGTGPSARQAPVYPPLPPRPRQPLPPYRPAGARPRESCHSDDDVPRDGHGFLARAGEADVTDRGDVKQRVRPGSKSSASVAERPATTARPGRRGDRMTQSNLGTRTELRN